MPNWAGKNTPESGGIGHAWPVSHARTGDGPAHGAAPSGPRSSRRADHGEAEDADVTSRHVVPTSSQRLSADAEQHRSVRHNRSLQKMDHGSLPWMNAGKVHVVRSPSSRD